VTLLPDDVNARIQGRLAGLLGMRLLELSPRHATSRLELRPELMNTVGSLHAATIVAIADTTCGAGCLASLPEGASGFVTLELKSNFVGTLRSGAVRCVARVRHAGRRTQLWEATIEDEATGKVIAFFSCTELLTYEPWSKA
jgi:1,4-dihydroxy-2-naphthoyl-CoA hydrolase